MTRLYVGNVATKSEGNELKELMSECGKIKIYDIKEGSGYIVRKVTHSNSFCLGVRDFRRSRRSY